LLNAKNGEDLLKTTGKVVPGLVRMIDRVMFNLVSYSGLKYRRTDKEAELALQSIMECRDKCRESRDVLGLIDRSAWRLLDDGWLSIYCAVTRELSLASHRVEVLLDDVGGMTGHFAVRLMRSFHGKVACLERMSYLWLGRMGQPRQGRSRTGYEISVGMNFGPPRPRRPRAVRISIERLVERGTRLMARAKKELKDSGTRTGK
jgi:hypothetical protein